MSLFLAVEDEAARFQALRGRCRFTLWTGCDSHICARCNALCDSISKQLLLLIDEAEAWISLAKNDYQALARLRKALQSGGMRTIMTSTKLLMQLNDLTRNWLTSPFLFGFSLVNLWSLEPDGERRFGPRRSRATRLSMLSRRGLTRFCTIRIAIPI